MFEKAKWFVVALLALTGTVLLLYFVMSPYQNCMRTVGDDFLCINYTNW